MNDGPTFVPHRTRFEIEHLLLGKHPGLARKVAAIVQEIEKLEMQGDATAEFEIGILQEILNDIVPEGSGTNEILGQLEDEEEQYWVEKLGKMGAIDILTIGKLQPETMDAIACLPNNVMYRTIRECLLKVTAMNKEIKDIELALTSGTT